MTIKGFIATSLDGYIADRNGSLDWLIGIPTPEDSDNGFNALLDSVDAVVMGRKTFDTVLNFDPWPYPKPVFVLSHTLKEIPPHLIGKCEILKGEPQDITRTLNARGLHHLYVDGGQTIQAFLAADLVDEMTITRVPILLGGGAALFGELEHPLDFELVKSELLPPVLQKNTYLRKR